MITWNPPIGLGPIRFYALFWMIGLVGAYFVVQKLYKEQKIKPELFEPLFFYCFFGILIGSRLGHCLFYEPQYYLSDFPRFIEMLLPIRFTGSGVRLIGYQGLASHGGTLGLMIALWLYVRKYKVPLWTVLDNIAIATPVTACCIRLGNLMNSEIIGRPTGGDWGFIFTQVDMLPATPHSSMRLSPMPCSDSSAGISIAACPVRWAPASSSATASPPSSPSASSWSSAKRCRAISR